MAAGKIASYAPLFHESIRAGPGGPGSECAGITMTAAPFFPFMSEMAQPAVDA
ncbi:MAG TPA: hypothetical protein VNJ52_07375 [Patescibacteria group bacterium]|nr:hypothetical protein [Patescibacteria group bacterium]